MFNEKEFLPKTLDECVISDVLSKDILRQILNGNLPFPAFGKCGILRLQALVQIHWIHLC